MDHLSACDCSLSYIEGDKKICQNNHNQTGFEICFQGGFSRFQPQKKKNDRDKNTLKSGLLSYILQATLSKTIAVKCSCRYREFKFMQTFQRTSYFHRRSKTTKNLPSVSSQSHANHSHTDENLIHGSINNNNHKD